ncbi:hypothetical protein MAHJHV57_44580 [Mycobacterium avium subsp. hominissuis]
MTLAWRAPDPAELMACDRRRRVRDCLAGILAEARRGELSADWREGRLSAALAAVEQHQASLPPEPVDPYRPVYDPDDPLAALKELDRGPMGLDLRVNSYFTLLDLVTTLPVAVWEPELVGSARAALDAWYLAALGCVAEACGEIPEVPDGDDERGVRTRLGIGTAWVKRRVECQRDADLLTESYEAGLVSLGAGDGGWVERSRRRVALWPDVIGFSRHEHWWLVDDPLYQVSRQWLPAYWTAHV